MTDETLLQKAWRSHPWPIGMDSAPPEGVEEIAPEFEEPVPQVKPGSGKG